MSKNPVVHFEMPYKDAKRVSKFYKSAFGWGMNDAGKEMGNYIVAMTTETDPKTTRPKTPGAINGGFYQKSKSSNPYPSFVISVDDLDGAMKAVKKAGGKVVGKPQEIPGIGLWAVFKDSEGNKVSILQAKM
jgi:predicted enzyme related to lactoylglutathione lyase